MFIGILLCTTVTYAQTITPNQPSQLYIWSNSQYSAYDIPSTRFQMDINAEGMLKIGNEEIDTRSVELISFDCPKVLAERNDLAYFACIDSLRGQMLFMGGPTKQSIVGITGMKSKSKTLFDLPTLHSDFAGTVEHIKVLSDGNYFLYEVRPDACDRIWKLWPDSERLVPVFTFRNKYQSLKFHWGLEYVADTHTLYMSEYGSSLNNPDNPEAPGTKLGFKGGATKIWCSDDDAETWHEFVDFRQDKSIFYERFHIHAIHYDQYDHRLYVSSGDAVDNRHSNKRLWWTDDGKKWHSVDWSYYWGTSNTAFSHGQVISFYADKDFIVAGGDDYNNCLYRIDKHAEHSRFPLEPVYYYQPAIKGLITQYATRFKKLSNGLITTYLAEGDSNGFPRCARLIGTFNGKDWFVLYSGTLEDGTMPLYQTSNFDEWNGHLYFGISEIENGNKVAKFVEMNIPQL